MKNWLRIPNGNIINLDFISHIQVIQNNEKWLIIAVMEGKEIGWALSREFDSENEAKAELACLTSHWL